MISQETRLLALIPVLVAVRVVFAQDLSATNTGLRAVSSVVIDFFYEPGCSECDAVREEVLPLLAVRHQGQYLLREWDLSVPENYRRLAGLMERHGLVQNAHVFVVVEGERIFAGLDQIRREFLLWVEQRVTSATGGGTPGGAIPPPAPVDEQALAARIARFTIAGVVVAGLVDGINPCAISTLIFLVSFLLLGQRSGRRVLVIGLVFCLATFLTYGAIGFGLLRALYALSWFPRLRRVVDLGLVGMLLMLAGLSVRDAFRFRRSGRGEDVVLQLSDGTKERIRRVTRTWLGRKIQIPAVFAIGVLVTGIESVCTGQVYVPTLAMVVRSGTSVARGMGLLALYNFMFIVPLLTVLVIAYRGLKIMALVEWSRRNVFYSKLAMSGFFLLLAGVFLWLNF